MRSVPTFTSFCTMCQGSEAAAAVGTKSDEKQNRLVLPMRSGSRLNASEISVYSTMR